MAETTAESTHGIVYTQTLPLQFCLLPFRLYHIGVLLSDHFIIYISSSNRLESGNASWSDSLHIIFFFLAVPVMVQHSGSSIYTRLAVRCFFPLPCTPSPHPLSSFRPFFFTPASIYLEYRNVSFSGTLKCNAM